MLISQPGVDGPRLLMALFDIPSNGTNFRRTTEKTAPIMDIKSVLSAGDHVIYDTS